jgi:hypothetical protein
LPGLPKGFLYYFSVYLKKKQVKFEAGRRFNRDLTLPGVKGKWNGAADIMIELFPAYEREILISMTIYSVYIKLYTPYIVSIE